MSRAKKWIQEGKDKGTIRTGGLHRNLGIPQDKKIPLAKIMKAERSKSPLMRKEAHLAETFKRMRKGK